MAKKGFPGMMPGNMNQLLKSIIKEDILEIKDSEE